MPTVEHRPEKPECLVCCEPPAFRYDVPPMTRLIGEIYSDGHVGLCALCRDIYRSTDLPFVAARRLAVRAFAVVPKLRELPGVAKKVAKKNAEDLYSRVLGLAKNERPFVMGEGIRDATSTWIDLDSKA